jgi:hypothetical protein
MEVMMNIIKNVGICVFCTSIILYGQSPVFIANVSDANATGLNNSHKIASRAGDMPSDTLYIVYHSNDSIYYTTSNDHGLTWTTPVTLSQGKYPALDVGTYGFCHVAWQQYDPSHGTNEIYYDCLDDYSPPINISNSPAQSTFPDVVVDSNLVAHVVWVEDINSFDHIYYRTCTAGVLGDTFRVSTMGSTQAFFSAPSISIFAPNQRVYVVWDCFDSASYSPYQIHSRYKENITWSPIESWTSYAPMLHSSIDFSHGEETRSFSYQDSISGNFEAIFMGGNGGGYATYGQSTNPVVSTVLDVWSYLFWQEDSSGIKDIFDHIYYFMTGWHHESLRELFSINESIQHPNSCGAYLTWTQGNTPPYSIYFVDMGYPVSSQEFPAHYPINTINVSPNPFTTMTTIKFQTPAASGGTLRIYDVTGRLVKEFDFGNLS